MSAAHDFAQWRQAQLARVEAALTHFLTPQSSPRLGEAMRHAVLGGGKRIRALLCLATAEALQGHVDAALRAACALELMHAYSLVHDDMPCMDNDVLRRGKPTVHIAYGQAMALLAGDSLQTLAFEVLTPAHEQVPASIQASLCARLSRASGQNGMAGGQAIDLLSIGSKLSQAELEQMHALKTGALLQASVAMGAACANHLTPEQTHALQTFADKLGLAFQVMDDVLDVTADSATLGKTAGKDAEHDKPTYVALMGLHNAQSYAQTLHEQACAALAQAQLRQDGYLRVLAQQVISRNN